MKTCSSELLLHIWRKQPPPSACQLGTSMAFTPQSGFTRARMRLGGLAAGLSSPSPPPGPECSRLLRFGQGPVFLELSKRLY